MTLDGTTVTGGVITNTAATLAVAATKTATLDDVTVNGGTIADNGTVHVDAARMLTLNDVTVTGGNLTNEGTIDTTATTVFNGVGVTNAGTIEATGGSLKIVGSLLGAGSVHVDPGAMLELDATVAGTQTIVSMVPAAARCNSMRLRSAARSRAWRQPTRSTCGRSATA